MDKCFDLFDEQKKCKVVEDEKGEILIQGLEEKPVNDGAELIYLLEQGFSIRQTHCTTNNDNSSRSHAIFKVVVRNQESSSSTDG